METCTNCGATLRAGAKFCTTCGTRLNETPPINDGWRTPRDTSPNDSQETSVLRAVTPPNDPQPTSIKGNEQQREYDRWTSAYSGSSSGTPNDPASRFISALEGEDKPADTTPEIEEADEKVDPTSTWVTPPPSAFIPPKPVTWSYQAGTGITPNTADEPELEDTTPDSWRAPSSWNQPGETGEPDIAEVESDSSPEPDSGIMGGQSWRPQEEETEAAESGVEPVSEADEENDLDEEIDAAGFRDGGDTEVDYLSGDENIDISGQEPPLMEPNDARNRAIELVDELRRMVRMMPGGGEIDPGAAAMSLTEASLNVTEFEDVRAVITELQEDPRDIQALSNLAKKADKIELLLNEHAMLAAAIESALKELNAQ